MENGTYRAKGIQGALGKTKGGKERVAVSFQLLDAEGNPTQPIAWFGYFTEKTFDRTIQALRLCGWEGDDISDLTGIDRNEVSLVIENEEYEGKVHAKVQWVNAPGGASLANQLDANEAKSFAQQMRGRILALKQSAPRVATKPAPRPSAGPQSPEPPPFAGTVREDDIPF